MNFTREPLVESVITPKEGINYCLKVAKDRDKKSFLSMRLKSFLSEKPASFRSLKNQNVFWFLQAIMRFKKCVSRVWFKNLRLVKKESRLVEDATQPSKPPKKKKRKKSRFPLRVKLKQQLPLHLSKEEIKDETENVIARDVASMRKKKRRILIQWFPKPQWHPKLKLKKLKESKDQPYSSPFSSYFRDFSKI